MNNLAAAYWGAGKLDLALPLFEETLKLMKAKLGPDHPTTLTSMNNLASAYKDAGSWTWPPASREDAQAQESQARAEHPDTLRSMGNLAGAYKTAGKLDLACRSSRRTLKLMKAKLGPIIPTHSTAWATSGKTYCDANQGEKSGGYSQGIRRWHAEASETRRSSIRGTAGPGRARVIEMSASTPPSRSSSASAWPSVRNAARRLDDVRHEGDARRRAAGQKNTTPSRCYGPATRG